MFHWTPQKSPAFVVLFKAVLWLIKDHRYDFLGTFDHFWGTKCQPIFTKFIVEVNLSGREYRIKFQEIWKKSNVAKVVKSAQNGPFWVFFCGRFFLGHRFDYFFFNYGKGTHLGPIRTIFRDSIFPSLKRPLFLH